MTPPATIFALASAPGRAGVAILRISGPDAARAYSCCVPQDIPRPREASLREIRDPANAALIDKALVLWFPAPHSFTGENIVEFHLHGGRAVLNAVTECLQKIRGFRLAEPGEYTRRAFENGKFDLTEAEAIADLVNAETEAQRAQAMRQFEGELGRLYEDWRQRLIKTLAYIEATIDFSDEELPKDTEARQMETVRALAEEIAKHLDDRHRGERLREGFHIAILGPPNAGKSSLLNALAKREAAIVSSIAGTTRDIVEVHLDLGGLPVILADTAGLRETADIIESEGVRRALARAERADLKLLVFDGEKWPALDKATAKLMDKNAITIVNKADLIEGLGARGWEKGQLSFESTDPQHRSPPLAGGDRGGVGSASTTSNRMEFTPISVKTGAGINVLLESLIAAADIQYSAAPPLTRARHRAALEECMGHLQEALAATETALRAEALRLATRALGRITGRVDVEDLLDVIFKDFCIGK